MTTVFETAAAASISELAQTVRYCCTPWWLMTEGTRMRVITMRMMFKLNKRHSDIFFFSGIAEAIMTGMGKVTISRSVVTSAAAIVTYIG